MEELPAIAIGKDRELYQPSFEKGRPMNELEKALAELNKTFENGLASVGATQIYVEKIPFSSPRLNYMTYGGVPIGKATEFFGPEGGGKTTAAIDVVGNAQKYAQKLWDDELESKQERLAELEQKNNKSDQKTIEKQKAEINQLYINGPRRCVYVDAENTLDIEWAAKNGVDIESLILIRPQDQTAEQVFQMVSDLIKTGLVIALVIDSIPMLVPASIYEQSMEKKAYCGVAGPLSVFSQKISHIISKYHTALIGINQVREDIDNPFNLYASPGGKAWKHLCALRMYFRKGSFLDINNNELKQSADQPAGNKSDVHIVKTKVCRPDRRIGFQTIKYDIGIDKFSDTVEMAIKYNIIMKNGAWYTFIDPETGEILTDYDKDQGEVLLKFQGLTKVLEYLRENLVIYEEVHEAVNLKLLEG